MINGGSIKVKSRWKKKVPYLATSVKLRLASASSSSCRLSVLTHDR